MSVGFLGYVLAVVIALTDSDPSEMLGAIWLVVSKTHNGSLLLLAALGLVCLWVALVGFQAMTFTRTFVSLCGFLLYLVATAATGHASDSEHPVTSILVHAGHIAAGCAWAGSVFIAWQYLRQYRRAPVEPTGLVLRLSQVAAVSLFTVLITSLYNLWRVLGASSGELGTYGSYLAVKLILVGVAAGIGAWNRWVGVPGLLEGRHRMRTVLEASLALEGALLGFGILAAVLLASTAPPA